MPSHASFTIITFDMDFQLDYRLAQKIIGRIGYLAKDAPYVVKSFDINKYDVTVYMAMDTTLIAKFGRNDKWTVKLHADIGHIHCVRQFNKRDFRIRVVMWS